ncbi:MAG: DUF2125 domain-containing protein [Paracoccus sp. (in: a-proteobacteria)]|nr:DUF2125 domain-containing protein [Paracoccus sp. (in: a-proteobacteria)]
MKRFYGFTALALVMATPGWALSPQEAWDALQQYYLRAGLELTTEGEAVEGDALVVRNVQSAQDQQGVSIHLEFGDMRFEPAEADAVRALVADQGRGEVTVDTPDGPMTMPITMNYPGAVTTISGTAGDMTFQSVMPTLEMVMVANVPDDGKTVEMPITLRATGLELTDQVTGTTDMTSTQEFSVQRVEMALSGRETATAEDVDVSELTGRDREAAKHGHSDNDNRLVALDALIGIDGISGNARSVMPEAATTAMADGDMSAAMRAGFDVNAVINYTGMSITGSMEGVDDDGETETGSMEMTGGAGSLSVAMNSNQLGYQAALDSLDVTVNSNELPSPVNLTVGPQAVDVQLPALAGDAPQPFKIANSAENIVLSDSTWDLFDEERALPREPASFDIDLTGNVVMNRDLMDRETEELMNRLNDPELTDDQRDEIINQVMEMGSPADPRDVSINQFALSLLGASITANGQLEVPEGGSVDAPVGNLSARYEGVNALLDTLGAAGIIPADQMMGVRMGLMMFARADGEDRMVTDLEFREDGSIFANGQQVR